MHPTNAISRKVRLLWAILAGTVSGMISAVTLEPVMHVMEQAAVGDVIGLLSSFSFSAGLAFALCGAALTHWVLGLRTAATATFAAMSLIGIAAAVYAAIYSFDNSTDSFLLSYAVASPIGALIVAGPVAWVGRLAHPRRTIGLAIALPTLWAVAVGGVIDPDLALATSGLATLYIGWQVILLCVLAQAGRRA